MNAHRFVPVPLELGEEERPPIWVCACGARRQDPTPRVTDECTRIELLGDDAA